MKILVTGAAGFIGINLCSSLLTLGHTVVGLDNLNDHSNQRLLKFDRVNALKHPNLTMITGDISDATHLDEIFEEHQFEVVYNLAAMPGVTYSTDHPAIVTNSNLLGFANVLESCRKFKVGHLVFASSSSVYGDVSWRCEEDTSTDFPKSYYASTKKSNEVMAASYASLYGMKISGVRLFTVYGPWGRPDMATWKFTEAIIKGEPITLYDKGLLTRDFTYVGDAVECLTKFAEDPAIRPHLDNVGKFQIYNIGSSDPIMLISFVGHLEQIIGKKAVIKYGPRAVSEVRHTFADMAKFRRHYAGQIPHTDIKEGLKAFVTWYRNHFKI